MARVDERISARRDHVRRDERSRRLRRTVGFLVVAVVVASLVAIERSSLVALDQIEVVGNSVVTESQILEAAGLELGTSTVRLRLGPARDRVEALPRIRTANVRRADPLTVRIEVEERRPALLVVSGEDRVLVDDEGVLIGRAGANEAALPEVHLSADVRLVIGGVVDDVPGLRAAVAVRRELTGPLRVRVPRYEADEDGRVSLVLDDGTRVLFGDEDRVDEKARSLGAVLEDLGSRRVDTIDVRAPGTPVVIPLQNGASAEESNS